MKNPERAISTLTGIVHALFMSVQSLAKTHPDPKALLTELETAEQLGLANLEPHAIDDAVIVGFQHVMTAIRQAAESAK
jgi:hypothetical protein